MALRAESSQALNTFFVNHIQTVFPQDLGRPFGIVETEHQQGVFGMLFNKAVHIFNIDFVV